MLSNIGAMVPKFFGNVPWNYRFLDIIHAAISCHSCHPVISFSFNWNWNLYRSNFENVDSVQLNTPIMTLNKPRSAGTCSTSTLLWHLRWGRRLSSPRHVLYKELEMEKTMFVTYWCLSALKMGAMFHPPCTSPLLGRHAPCCCIIILIYALNQLCIQILLIACHFLSISLCALVVGW